MPVFVAIAALSAEMLKWVTPSMTGQQVLRCGQAQLHIRPIECTGSHQRKGTSLVLYVAWFLSYSCFSCFCAGLVHGDMVLPLSECLTIMYLFLTVNLRQ